MPVHEAGLVDWLSHEIRTPLTVVQGYLEMVLDEVSGPLGPRQRELLLCAAGGSDRLLALADHLLLGVCPRFG